MFKCSLPCNLLSVLSLDTLFFFSKISFMHKTTLKNIYPSAYAFSYIVMMAIVLAAIYSYTDFTVIYGLDDAYIHLSAASELAKQGILSIDGYSYASASSSPLWTFLLASIYFVVGDAYFYLVPLFLNFLFQIYAIYLMTTLVLKYNMRNHVIHPLLVIAGAIFFLGMPLLLVIGMEHSLQLMLAILMIKKTIDTLEANEMVNMYSFMGLAFLSVMTRYEDLALITAISLVLAYKLKQPRFLLLIGSGLVPIVLYGVWSTSMGLGFLPSSITIKSSMTVASGYSSLFTTLFSKLSRNLSLFHITVPFLMNAYIFYRSRNEENKVLNSLTIICMLTAIAHIMFARAGYPFRYEVYVVVFSLINIFLYYAADGRFSKHIMSVLPLVFFMQIYTNTYLLSAPPSNIYNQQIAFAEFIKSECNGCSVAVNDIGAVAYFTDARVLDLVGLASPEVEALRKSKNYNPVTREQLMLKHDVTLAVVYDTWMNGMGDSGHYTKIAEWHMDGNVVCGDDKISFYAKNGYVDIYTDRMTRYLEKHPKINAVLTNP